jgi:type III pantothenate kinase
MRLLIDAGNTRIKWAYVSNNEWLQSGVLPVEKADELPKHIPGSQAIEQVWVSNVAGENVAHHIRAIDTGHAGQIHFIAARDIQCGVSNGYTNTGQLGSDRWAALIAAWQLAKRKCMVVNCGTAITIDSLSEGGEFIGGLILPGVELMQRSLFEGASQLKPERGRYAMFPLNTADALFSGAIQACCGAIERQYSLLEDDTAPLMLSGGSAGILAESIKLPLNVVDNLVLQGLLLIAQESDA